jgi:hypothetical protein
MNIIKPIGILPKRQRGRQSPEAKRKFQRDMRAFADLILEIQSRLELDISTRGWCYILEEHGLRKGEFDEAELRIGDARKMGLLPIDICAEDSSRAAENLESLDNETPEEFAAGWVDHLDHAHAGYDPISFWESQKYYVEMMVEKIDLLSLFKDACAEFHVAIANAKGWADIRSRYERAKRFQRAERSGKTPVLLYCGDHDPAGLHISDSIRNNFEDIVGASGWQPDNLIVDRFGLNADFIEEQGLTWIDNLETGSGKRLDDPDHHLFNAEYVQSYIEEFGARKVEANALVVRPEAGRCRCRSAILKYVNRRAAKEYERQRYAMREQVRAEIARLMRKPR